MAGPLAGCAAVLDAVVVATAYEEEVHGTLPPMIVGGGDKEIMAVLVAITEDAAWV